MEFVGSFKSMKSVFLRGILCKRYGVRFRFVETYQDFVMRASKESDKFFKDFLEMYISSNLGDLDEEEIREIGYEIIEVESPEYLDVTFH